MTEKNHDHISTSVLTKDWNSFAPFPSLMPLSEKEKVGDSIVLKTAGNGDKNCFGGWEAPVRLEKNKWYKASVLARVNDIAEPGLNLLAFVGGHYLDVQQKKGEIVCLEQTFQYQGDELYAESFFLILRATEKGSVEWSIPQVTEIAPPQKRLARIATVRFGEMEDKEHQTLDGLRDRIAVQLEMAGKVKPDLVLLTELAPVSGLNEETIDQFTAVKLELEGDVEQIYCKTAESVPEGPTCKILSMAAKKYHMYVAAGLCEKRGEHFYNTVVLFDREGRFAGQYDKTHLTIGELMQGISCGDSYPVFELDFGKVAFEICYDEWFPEITRYYAYQGAELLLLPVAGGKPIMWRTRAMDNNLYFVSSSQNPPSMIIDAGGIILVETHQSGFVYADLDMSNRPVNYYKDRTLVYGMPGISQEMQNTADSGLQKKLADIYGGKNGD